jgi:hypothetical protein
MSRLRGSGPDASPGQKTLQRFNEGGTCGLRDHEFHLKLLQLTIGRGNARDLFTGLSGQSVKRIFFAVNGYIAGL